MTVVLDTDLVPVRERAEALRAAYDGERPRRTVRVESGPVRHRVERVTLGPHLHMLRTGGSALHVSRTERHVRADAPEHVAIGVHRRGRTVVSTPEGDRQVPVGQLNGVDMTRPYRLVHHDVNDHDVLILDNRAAGLSVDLVRSAVGELGRSPLYRLVRAHLAGLYDATGGLSARHRLLTGQATTALVRALLTTAAGGRAGNDAMEDALEPRLTLYVDRHLADPTLSVSTLAAAHHISVRHLYNVWAAGGHGEGPAEWITSRRLERARDDLITGDPDRSIAAVARRWGFVNGSHFSRRFRAAFGSSPREWRAGHHAVAG